MEKLMEIIERHTEGNYLIGNTTREEMAKDILDLFDVSRSFNHYEIEKLRNSQSDAEARRHLKNLIENYG